MLEFEELEDEAPPYRLNVIKRLNGLTAQKEGLSAFETSMLVLKETIGMGILGIPFALSKCGLVVGNVITVCVVYLNCYQIILFTKIIKMVSSRIGSHHIPFDYSEVIFYYFSQRKLVRLAYVLKILCDILCCYEELFFITTAFFISTESINQVLAEYNHHIRTELLMAAVTLVVAFASLLSNLKRLHLFAIVGNTVLMCVYVLIMISCGINSIANKNLYPSLIGHVYLQAFTVLKSCTLVCEVTANQNEMKCPEQISKVMISVASFTAFMYVLLPSLFYMRFGKDITIDFLDNFEGRPRYVQTIKILNAVGVVCVVPPRAYMLFQFTFPRFAEWLHPIKHIIFVETTFRIGSIFICSVLGYLMATSVKYMIVVYLFAFLTSAYILPSSIMIIESRSVFRMFFSVFIVCGAVAVIVTSTYHLVINW